jgi:MFS family permease
MVGGGVITQLWSWRGIFWINVPILAVMLVATPRVLVESRKKINRRLDLGGAVAVTAGLVAVVYALTSAPKDGWAAGSVCGVGLLGLAALIAFAAIEARHPAPLTPPAVVTKSNVLVPNGAVVLQSMVGIAWLYLLTLYFQDVHDADAMQSGLLFAPMTVASIAGAAVAGRAVGRHGVRHVALTGMALVAAGIAEMAATTPMESGIPLTIAGMVIGEFGFMLTSVSLTVAVTTAVAHEHAGLAAGLYGTSTQLGGGIGLAIVATVVTAATDRADVDSHAIQIGFLACLAFTLLAALLVAGRMNRKQTPLTTRRDPVDPPVYGAQSPLRDTGGSTDQ